MKKKTNCKPTISVKEICDQILKYKTCPGITKEQVKALIAGNHSGKLPSVIAAIQQTAYYSSFINIPTPQSKLQPIHYLFQKFS